MTDREVMQQALDALERVDCVDSDCDILSLSLCEAVEESIAALRAAIARPEQPNSIALKSAREVGENGAIHSESERLLFEEYMHGHNWKCDSWNSEKSEYTGITLRTLYAVFRARAAIAQPEQTAEPVAWAIFAGNGNMRLWSRKESYVQAQGDELGLPLVPLYTHPAPVRQSLTIKEIGAIHVACGTPRALHIEFARAIEAKHGITTPKAQP